MKYEIKILNNAVKIIEGSTYREFIFTRSSVQYFRNSYFVRTTKLPSFHFFKITIDTRQNQCNISISDFNQHIETIHWKKIKEIPDILDALCGLYKLQHFDNQQIDNNLNVLIYHSKIGRKSRQIFHINKTKYHFQLQFFNSEKTSIHFNFINNRLFLKDNIIRFQEIEKIVVYLDKMERSNNFDVFAIETFLKNNSVITLVEINQIINSQKTAYEPLNWIHGKMVFSAVIELIEKLQQFEELDDIPIKLEIQ